MIAMIPISATREIAAGAGLVAATALDLIFQHLSGLGVHPDFMRDGTTLYVERIAQAAAAFFALQFLIYDLAGTGFERDLTCLIETDRRLRREFLTLICEGSRCRGTGRRKTSY
jgi:hypothetical protein